MTYNISAISDNVTGVLDVAQGVNDNLVGGWLFSLFLIAICTIIFLGALQSTGSARAGLVAASFIGSILSLLLVAVNLLPNLALFICIIVLGASIVFAKPGE